MWINTAVPVTDPAAADWAAERFHGSTGHMSGQVPVGFDAYCRILHRPDSYNDVAAPRWADIAAETGAIMHPAVQWHRLLGGKDTDPDLYLPWRGFHPRHGQLDPGSFAALLPHLVDATKETDGCVFGFWVGHHDVQPGERSGFTRSEFDSPHFRLAGREMILLQGDLSALANQVTEHPKSVAPPPMVMWPRDRSWYSLSEIDFDSTIVGGASDLIAALVDDPVLESFQVPPSLDLSIWGDTVNE
ncbi:hypothetical protein IEU95_14145 [Hoyosella rhizosphaerae]|uniref:Uncharacterized protein n=1 Tax=Hoyosella rhizosphaerae TaxID=1755582 RepID=A0A916UHT2_9ACTN|nr:hypothetical protein [Hoyosella rhizosphaerae]MBN4927983.1 hypothetical protein [Hoyosella rhizosphaerae]GGC71447.1 hypothetical protein GCM10011410_25530 [Hoyosella rhizosphaerae]